MIICCENSLEYLLRSIPVFHGMSLLLVTAIPSFIKLNCLKIVFGPLNFIRVQTQNSKSISYVIFINLLLYIDLYVKSRTIAYKAFVLFICYHKIPVSAIMR